MSPIGDAHLSAVNRYNHQLSRQLAPDLLVSVQNPLRLGRVTSRSQTWRFSGPPARDWLCQRHRTLCS